MPRRWQFRLTRVAVVDRLQQFSLRESGDSRMGYGLSIAGHVIIVLLLMFGLLERIELIPVTAIPDAGHGASRIAAIGRHPKPSTEGDRVLMVGSALTHAPKL